MNKIEFLQKKKDNEEIQTLTSVDFEKDQHKVVLVVNYHDDAHRERIAELFLKSLQDHSAKVLEWLQATSKADLVIARTALQAERDELNTLIG